MLLLQNFLTCQKKQQVQDFYGFAKILHLKSVIASNYFWAPAIWAATSAAKSSTFFSMPSPFT